MALHTGRCYLGFENLDRAFKAAQRRLREALLED
jgi:hypothetical protein